MRLAGSKQAFYGFLMTTMRRSASALAEKARDRLSQLPGHGLPCANPAPTRRIMRSAVSFIKAAASVSGAQIQLTNVCLGYGLIKRGQYV